MLEPYPEALYVAVIDAVPAWINTRLREVSIALSGTIHPELELAQSQLVSAVTADVKRNLADLLATDVDIQNINPLQVLRDSTKVVADAMLKVGIPLPQRDQFEVRAMPNDIYAIGPLTWRDLGEDVHDAGITWGAWKAAVILSRRRDEGMISS